LKNKTIIPIILFFILILSINVNAENDTLIQSFENFTTPYIYSLPQEGVYISSFFSIATYNLSKIDLYLAKENWLTGLGTPIQAGIYKLNQDTHEVEYLISLSLNNISRAELGTTSNFDWYSFEFNNIPISFGEYYGVAILTYNTHPDKPKTYTRIGPKEFSYVETYSADSNTTNILYTNSSFVYKLYSGTFVSSSSNFLNQLSTITDVILDFNQTKTINFNNIFYDYDSIRFQFEDTYNSFNYNVLMSNNTNPFYSYNTPEIRVTTERLFDGRINIYFTSKNLSRNNTIMNVTAYKGDSYIDTYFYFEVIEDISEILPEITTPPELSVSLLSEYTIIGEDFLTFYPEQYFLYANSVMVGFTADDYPISFTMIKGQEYEFQNFKIWYNNEGRLTIQGKNNDTTTQSFSFIASNNYGVSTHNFNINFISVNESDVRGISSDNILGGLLNLNKSTKLLIAFLIISVGIIVSWLIGISTGYSLIGGIIGLVYTIMAMGVFVYFGFIPMWVVAFIGLIIAVFVANSVRTWIVGKTDG
jgi:hypothetical protein